jgi:hypothetical protein
MASSTIETNKREMKGLPPLGLASLVTFTPIVEETGSRTGRTSTQAPTSPFTIEVSGPKIVFQGVRSRLFAITNVGSQPLEVWHSVDGDPKNEMRSGDIKPNDTYFVESTRIRVNMGNNGNAGPTKIAVTPLQ